MFMRRIFAFGDSIVAGRKLPGSQSWISRISDFFMENYPGETLMYNLGVTGEGSAGLLERITRDLSIRTKYRLPDDFTLTFIATGLNDSKLFERRVQASYNIFESNVRKIIKISKKYSNLVVVMGLTRVSEKIPLDFRNQTIAGYNDILRRVSVDEGLLFVDIFDVWPNEQRSVYSEDGVHPNADGHAFIFEQVLSVLRQIKVSFIDTHAILSSELRLDNNEFVSLNLSRDRNPPFKTDLFLGLDGKERGDHDLVLGGPCLRNDIYGISLNTFYQILMPLKVAQHLNKPCCIYLGIKEEILLSPEKKSEYKLLKEKISVGTRRIAANLGVQVEFIDTSESRTNRLIESVKKKKNIFLSKQESQSLYSYSEKHPSHRECTEERIRANERVITCHSQEFLTKATGYSRFLIVEDLEQLKAFRRANNQKKGKKVIQNTCTFSAFLPLPNIYANATMFKGDLQERILLFRSKEEYEKIWAQASPASKTVYLEIMRLMGKRIPNLSSGVSTFTHGMAGISDSFKES